MYPQESPFCTSKEGFRDLTACIDLSTYRRLPWENNLPFFLVSFFEGEDGAPLPICPRNLLRSVTDRLQSQLGCQSLAGVEFEASTLQLLSKTRTMLTLCLQYFHFAETAHTLAEKRFADLKALTPGSEWASAAVCGHP